MITALGVCISHERRFTKPFLPRGSASPVEMRKSSTVQFARMMPLCVVVRLRDLTVMCACLCVCVFARAFVRLGLYMRGCPVVMRFWPPPVASCSRSQDGRPTGCSAELVDNQLVCHERLLG
eukprot:2965450-Amphidinium_carterae.1